MFVARTDSHLKRASYKRNCSLIFDFSYKDYRLLQAGHFANLAFSVRPAFHVSYHFLSVSKSHIGFMTTELDYRYLERVRSTLVLRVWFSKNRTISLNLGRSFFFGCHIFCNSAQSSSSTQSGRWRRFP